MVEQGFSMELGLSAAFKKKNGNWSLLSSDLEVSSLKAIASLCVFQPASPSLCHLYNLNRKSVFKNLLSTFWGSYF